MNRLTSQEETMHVTPYPVPFPALLPLALAVSLALATPPAPAQEGAGLEEIVVTARKREENLMATPVSISAFTGDDLADRQIATAEQLSGSTPNLTFNRNSVFSGSNAAAVVFLRGIGQSDFVPTVEPGVGIYVDGVYVSQSTGSVLELMDIESVQVLRGPQGTLFGRNTIGGAILVNSRKPDDTFHGDAEVIYGAYDRTDVRGSVNVPLADNLFGRISALYTNRDGFVERPLLGGDDENSGDDNTLGVRGALRWEATAALAFDLSFDYSRDRENPAASAIVSNFILPASPLTSNTAFHNFFVAPSLVPTLGPGAFMSDFWLPPDKHTDLSDMPGQHSDVDIWGVNLTANWELSETLAVKSITSYRDLETDFSNDWDHTPLAISHADGERITGWQWSQELQLTGKAFADRMTWLLGYYHFEEDNDYISQVTFPALTIASGALIDNRSDAAFGQFTFNFTDRWSLTAGGRYTDETKTFTVDDRIQFIVSSFPLPPIPGLPVLPPAGFRLIPLGKTDLDVSEFDPYVNVAFQWSEDLMLYASYSEGFKSGGFELRNQAPAAAPPSFNPEYATVYELGLKWSGLDNRLRVTAAGFFTEYDDLQILVTTGGFVPAPLTTNAGEAEIAGFEIEAVALPLPQLELSGGVGYFDAEYTELDPRAIANGTFLDTPLPFVSKWQTNLSAVYTLAAPALAGSFRARVDWSYRTDYATFAQYSPDLVQDGVSLLNASLTYVHDSDRWEVALSGTNITDEFYILGGNAFIGNSGYTNSNIGRPSEWALRFRYRF
jgi:iron complex outermembrane receptor protein